MKSQTKNSSYRTLSFLLKYSEDSFEVEILKRIIDDYNNYHKNDLIKFEKLISKEEICCPRCKSKNFISHGKDKNGTKRLKCKECGKTFNALASSQLFASKININAWFAFLECIISGTSTKAACIVAKISLVTGSSWMKKIFKALKEYQKTIILHDTIYIDETFIHEDKSKIYYMEEIGKVRKVPKQPRGISRNKICILVATDTCKSFAEIVCHGRPQKDINYEICKKHIMNEAKVIGDEDTSLTHASKNMNWNRTQVKGNTEKSYEILKPVDELCGRLKFFMNKHRGFKKHLLQDFLNLFIFIDNEMHTENDLYKVTMKLMKLIIDESKSAK